MFDLLGGGVEGLGLVELGDRLFGGHQAFDHDLSNVAAVGDGLTGLDFEHKDGIFDLVEPKSFSLVLYGNVGAVDVGRPSPSRHIPQSTEFPDSSYAPAVGEEKVFHGNSSEISTLLKNI